MQTVSDLFFKPTCKTEYLRIQAGDKIFTDLNLFSTPIGQIKKAIKYLTKYEKSQVLQKERTKVIDKM